MHDDLIDPQDPTDDQIKAAQSQPDDILDLVDPDDDKHEKAKPPSVLGEEDAFSGDMSTESPDIDAELEKVGLRGDRGDDTPTPLGVSSELDNEVE